MLSSTFDDNQYANKPNPYQTDPMEPQTKPAGPTMPQISGAQQQGTGYQRPAQPPAWQQRMYRGLANRQVNGPSIQTNVPIAGMPGPGPQVSVPNQRPAWGGPNMPQWAQNVNNWYGQMRGPQSRNFFSQGRMGQAAPPEEPPQPIGPVPPPEY